MSLLHSALEIEAVHSHHETAELRNRLNDLEDHHEALAQVSLAVVRVVRPSRRLLPDRLQVRDAMSLGAHYGAAVALASAHLCSGQHLAGLELGFPEGVGDHDRRALLLDFSGAAAVIAAVVDVDTILLEDEDLGLDGS